MIILDKTQYVTSQIFSILGLQKDVFFTNFEISQENVDEFAGYLSIKIGKEEDSKIEKPILNTRLNSIETELMEINNDPYIKKWYWPSWKSHVIALSHDIDKISAPKKHVWKIRKRFSLIKTCLNMLGLYNLYDNFKEFERIEKKFNARSAFYVLLSDYDALKIQKNLINLRKKGWDIGLHGSFGTSEDIDKLKNDKQGLENVINEKIFGNRFHFLKFTYPKTWELLADAGFTYDTTCGYNEHVGFRSGISFPFFPPSTNWDVLNIVELPLNLMDTTLWTYKKFSEEEALQYVLKKYEEIKELNGLFSLLWHYGVLHMKGGRIYSKILQNLDYSCILTPKEIATWWINRNNCQITREKTGKTQKIIFNTNTSLNEICILIKKDCTLKNYSDNVQIIENTEKLKKVLFTSGTQAKIEIELA